MIKFYNTLTKRKEAFKPRRKKEVGIYSCGLTVYNYAHIGNFRTFLMADILRRYLEYRGFKVRHVMNFTDVGHMTQDDIADATGKDKMENAAQIENKTPQEIAEFYIKAFLEDSERLGLKEPEVRPRATEHIEEMLEMIEKLVAKGYAYVSDGNVYFDVSKFRKYGKLSGNTLETLKAGARVGIRKDKRDPSDFALWKRDPMHIMQWDSIFGRGFPGWHIECSAMGMKYLGKSFDIHTGGEDMIFPHHECEIAQSEGYTGRKFVNYWLHTRHLLVNNQKMSKSLGNFYTLRDLTGKDHDPKAIRYLLISAHYRTRLNFTQEGIKSTGSTVQRLEEFMVSLAGVKEGRYSKKVSDSLKKLKKDFVKAMDDDLNVPLATSKVFAFMKSANSLIASGKVDPKNAQEIREAFMGFGSVLGLDLQLSSSAWMTIDEAPSGVRELIMKRDGYREMGDYRKADGIRVMLRKKYSIEMEDTREGIRWKKA